MPVGITEKKRFGQIMSNVLGRFLSSFQGQKKLGKYITMNITEKTTIKLRAVDQSTIQF